MTDQLKNTKCYYYYIRDYDQRPRISVCILYDEKTGVSARGVSLCSMLDMPNKQTGRELAEQRALKAFLKKKSFGEIKSSNSLNVFINCKIDSYEMYENFHFKCHYNPILNSVEKKLIKN